MLAIILNAFKTYRQYMLGNKFIAILIICIVLDVLLGFIRAWKDGKFNSSTGINGLTRKASMLLVVCFVAALDLIMFINLISLLPTSVKAYVPVSKIGLEEFFCLMYAFSEAISIIKNTALLNLPCPEWLSKFLQKILDKMTIEVEVDEIKELLDEEKEIKK